MINGLWGSKVKRENIDVAPMISPGNDSERAEA